MTSVKSTNITWHKPLVTQPDRDERNGYKGVVLWFTGLPSSGKSTLAHQLERSLFDKGCNGGIIGQPSRTRVPRPLSPLHRRRCGWPARLIPALHSVELLGFRADFI